MPSEIHTVPSKIHTVPSEIHTAPSEIHTVPSEIHAVLSEMQVVPSEMQVVPSEMQVVPSDHEMQVAQEQPPAHEQPVCIKVVDAECQTDMIEDGNVTIIKTGSQTDLCEDDVTK